MRLSSDKDDAGYAAWCHLNGDRKLVRVYLDGILQRDAAMADDGTGEVRRCVRTAQGNIAMGHDEILMETVKGRVEIVIEDRV